jgi:hypothetical protein
LFALFQAQGLEKQSEYMQCFTRLLFNYGRTASYNGIRVGREQVESQIKEMSDPTSYHILTFLWKNPEADNQKIARYLDRETLRLSTLSLNRDPLFAPLPANIINILRASHVTVYKGEQWKKALEHPLTKVGLTEYLSRRRAESKDARLKNVLVNWPRLFKLHKQQRKASGKVTK